MMTDAKHAAAGETVAAMRPAGDPAVAAASGSAAARVPYAPAAKGAAPAPSAAPRRAGALRIVLAFALVICALVVLFLFAVNTGTLKVRPEQLFRGLFVAYDKDVATIYDLRFPRIFIAMVGGAATAVSGVLLQAVIKNPLADPGIIGVNAGASLAATIITALSPALLFITPTFAFFGGLLAFCLVYSLSWQGGRLSPVRIILVGVAISAMFSGLLSAMGASSADSSSVTDIVNGNITQKTWSDLWTLVAYAAVGLLGALIVARRCDLLVLEDKTARSLGVNVGASRMVVSFVAVCLASVSTAIMGPISFLGLIVPHLARLMVGSGHRVLVPFTMFLGAFCLLLADTIGRSIMPPLEISAATVMAVVGGPVFVFLLRKARYGYGD